MKSAKGLLEGMAEAAEEKKAKPEPEKKDEKKKDEKKSKHATKRPRKIHIERAKGGFIAHHDYDAPEDGAAMDPSMMEPHVIPDMAGLQAHMSEHMSEPEPGEAAAAMGPEK